MLISLGVLWVFTELVYDHKQNMEESIKNRVSKVLKHIDMPTILFFLGILMSVAALQSAGLLTDFADFLDKNVHEVYTIAGITGLLSAVIDNVPLVAACMGMYPSSIRQPWPRASTRFICRRSYRTVSSGTC